MKTPNAPAPASRRRRRLAVGLLALLFLAPVLISFYLYYGAEDWRPRGDASYGDLISPARPLPEVSLPTPEGQETGAQFLRGKWSLIYIDRLDEGRCSKQCRDALYQIRQVRVSLNEKADRVQRVLLYSGSCCEQPFFTGEHSGLISAAIDSPEGRRLLQEFSDVAAGAVFDRGRIYLSDPLGNLLMSYPPQSDPKELREDLLRLLKLSHIG